MPDIKLALRMIYKWTQLPGLAGLGVSTCLAFVANTLIAGFLVLLSSKFSYAFVYSQCIGMSIFFIKKMGQYYFPKTIGSFNVAIYIFAIVVGSFSGMLLGSWILGVQLIDGEVINYQLVLGPVYIGLFFGMVVSYIHFSRSEMIETLELLKSEENARLMQEKQLAESQLKLIQAQIEPHFLFNTLANINSLIQTDATKAQYMLEQLNQYLRTSLARTREGKTTLRQEIELVTAYLSIIKVRMGSRLDYSIDIDEATLDIAVPPLILQPIVENAIRHGLEPKVEGGEIRLISHMDSGNLHIEVQDTGIGLEADWSDGTGLSNVRNRVKIIYGDKGRFSLQCNKLGTTVIFDLPVNQTTRIGE